MQKTRPIHYLRAALVTSLVTLTSLTSWAARDFTPQAGTWVISSEVDGKPGRGFAIDVQGNTFFIQVFGYEKNGDATFYAASGQMQGDTITVPLERYRGGRSFGSEPRDAQADTSVGDVTIHFRNGVQGTIQLPGEPAVEIARYVFAGRDAPYFQPPAGRETTQEALWLGLNAQGQVVSDWQAELQSGADLLRLKLTHGAVRNTLDCERPAQTQSIRCTAANAEQAPVVKAVEFRAFGQQVAGKLTLQDDSAAPLRLQGIISRTYLQRCIPPVIYVCYTEGLDAYGSEPVSYRPSPTYLPNNGTWLIEDEITGRPGRGISLDVQGDTMLMQVFGYQPGGQPSFYMGFGHYTAESGDSTASSARFALNRYAGGRSLGGEPASAQLVEQAGEVGVQVPLIAAKSLTYATVQFPGEAPKRMRRYALEPMNTPEEKLLGEWFLLEFPTLLVMDRMDGDSATNADKSVRCEVVAEIDDLRCGWSDPNVRQPYPMRSDPFDLTRGYLRVRDRHGNLTGLGDVPMD